MYIMLLNMEALACLIKSKQIAGRGNRSILLSEIYESYSVEQDDNLDTNT